MRQILRHEGRAEPPLGWPDPLSVAMRPDSKRIYRVPALAAATTIVWLRFGT